MELIPTAKVTVVGLYRNEQTFEPVEYYFKAASKMEERVAMIVDPMLATGGTLIATIDMIKSTGCKTIKGLFFGGGAGRIKALAGKPS